MRKALLVCLAILSMVLASSTGPGKAEVAADSHSYPSSEKYIQIKIDDQGRTISELDKLQARRLVALDLSPDGLYLLGIRFSRAVSWDVESGEELHRYFWPDHAHFLPSGHVGVFRDGELHVAQAGAWDKSSAIGKHSGGILALDLAFSPEGKIVAAANNNFTLRLWDISTGKLWKSFESGAERVVIAPPGL